MSILCLFGLHKWKVIKDGPSYKIEHVKYIDEGKSFIIHEIVYDRVCKNCGKIDLRATNYVK